MKVIKVVYEENGNLVSIFACGKWKKKYAEGVKTEPDIGYLFAYSRKNLNEAKHDMGAFKTFQYWLAEAEVVGRIHHITVMHCEWRSFWEKFKPQMRVQGAEYLLCSSITLIRKLA